MAEWKSRTLDDIFPGEISSIVSSTESTLEGAKTFLELLSASALIASGKIIGFIDPLKEIVEGLIDTIEIFLDTYIKTGVYVMSIPPGLGTSSGLTQSTDEFIGLIEESLYDTSDPNRPVFSGTAGTVMIVFMVGAPSFEGIVEKANAIGELFDFEDLKIKRFLEKLTETVFALESIIGSLEPITIKVTGDISSFASSGALRIGDEIASYSSKTEDSFRGVIVAGIHPPGVSITGTSTTSTPAGTSTLLTTDILSVGVETTISVESTDGFPSSGSVIIDSEELAYVKKTDTTLSGVVPKKEHFSGASVVLAKGSSFHGSPPDWENIVLFESMVSFDSIINGLSNIADGLRPAFEAAEEAAKFIAEFAKTVDLLITRLSDIEGEIVKFLELLSISGVYFITVTGTGGVSELIDMLKTADGKPEFDKTSYTAGIVLMAGEEGAVALTTLFGS